MVNFFISRPVFSWVIALFIMIGGALSITRLPIEQYPRVAPPTLNLNVTYPGGSARVLEDSVLAVIEQEINGTPNLAYMEAVAQANGNGSLSLSFEPGTNIDLAQVEVQNRLARATPRLPSAVVQQGIRVDRARTNHLVVVSMSSDDPNMNANDLTDYAARYVQPELLRLDGVGQVQLFGSERAMRIWIDPEKLLGYNLSPSDVTNAIARQNAQISAGSIGELPIVAGQTISATVVVSGQLSNQQEFGNIVLRANADGSIVRLHDVARTELGAQNYATAARLNGQTAAGMGIQLSPTGNALATATAVRKRMQELERNFPPGVSWKIAIDNSTFVDVSIRKVVLTLFEAIFLVFIVMYLFLQNWRFTLIPAIVVPITLLGTFGMMLAAGFSINVLTMFAMVLVIGIVVDDAIVVVENVERLMKEEDLSPKKAARKAMEQITRAVFGMTVMLVAVFMPLAFFSGSVGNIYRQFALVMTVAVVVSTFFALTLTPALCATMLKKPRKDDDDERQKRQSERNTPAMADEPHARSRSNAEAPMRSQQPDFEDPNPPHDGDSEPHPNTQERPERPQHASHQHKKQKGWAARFFSWFNRQFKRLTEGYMNLVQAMMRKSVTFMLIFLALSVAAGWLFMRLPTSFLPQEDQGQILINVQLPPGATRERTLAVVKQVEEHVLKQPEVQNMIAVLGFSPTGQGQNSSISFVSLKDWADRSGDGEDADSLVRRLRAELGSRIKDANVLPLSPAPIQELGNSSGFSLRLQDRSNQGFEALLEARNKLLSLASESSVVTNVRPDGLEPAAQVRLTIDREKAAAHGVEFSEISSLISTSLGTSYVNDFPSDGRMQRVIVQAEAYARMQPEDILKLSVLNNEGRPVTLETFAHVDWTTGPMQTVRYNGYPAMRISGNAADGHSTGEAMEVMQKLVAELPDGFDYEWTGQSREEMLAGNQAVYLYAFALLAVFLALSALYESWSIPLAVVLVVPLGILGVVLAITVRGFDNDIFFQVGLVTIMGLSAKNAIMIVEFARDEWQAGMEAGKAALDAAKLRFRPIIMTSLAFAAGVVPLTIASGASSASQRAIGTGVIGGMVVGTVLTVFFVPVFFDVVIKVFKPKRQGEDDDEDGNAQNN